MDENEFEIDGKVYVAVPDDGEFFCSGCAFESYTCPEIECRPKHRLDGRNVIFVEKQQ